MLRSPPGIAVEGMNSFVIERSGAGGLLQRIGLLRRLIEVVAGERILLGVENLLQSFAYVLSD